MTEAELKGDQRLGLSLLEGPWIEKVWGALLYYPLLGVCMYGMLDVQKEKWVEAILVEFFIIIHYFSNISVSLFYMFGGEVDVS